MRIGIILIVLISLIVLIVGCESGSRGKDIAVICNKPYIQVGADCCLDENDNSICDKDEAVAGQKAEETSTNQETLTTSLPKKTYTLEQLKRDIDTVYGKDVMFSENKLGANKIYDIVNSDDYDIYDSSYVTIFKIINPSMKLNSFIDFKSFVDDYAAKKFELFESNLHESINTSLYEVYPSYFTKVHEGKNGKIIEYNQRAKIYRIYFAKTYNTTKPETPWGSAIVYIMCSPELIAAVYPDDIAWMGTSWSNLKEDEYESMLNNQLIADRNNAIEEADELLGLCAG